MLACKLSNINVLEHFAKVGKTIIMPKNAAKVVEDYKLSRYACYLIVQNGDPKKEVIALVQTILQFKLENSMRQELLKK